MDLELGDASELPASASVIFIDRTSAMYVHYTGKVCYLPLQRLYSHWCVPVVSSSLNTSFLSTGDKGKQDVAVVLSASSV